MRTSRALLPILAAGLVSLCSAAALAVPDASSTNSGNGDVYAPNSSSGIATSFTVVKLRRRAAGAWDPSVPR